MQIKTFSSMFRKDPHKVTTYFGSIAKTMGDKGSNLCESDHQFSPYYLAGLTYYKLDSLFNSGEIDRKYKKVRFYITMLVPMIASKEVLPPFNSQKKTESYCNPIIEKLNNEEQCKCIFLSAIEIIDRSNAPIEDKQALKSIAMTNQILSAYEGEKI